MKTLCVGTTTSYIQKNKVMGFTRTRFACNTVIQRYNRRPNGTIHTIFVLRGDYSEPYIHYDNCIFSLLLIDLLYCIGVLYFGGNH